MSRKVNNVEERPDWPLCEICERAKSIAVDNGRGGIKPDGMCGTCKPIWLQQNYSAGLGLTREQIKELSLEIQLKEELKEKY